MKNLFVKKAVSNNNNSFQKFQSSALNKQERNRVKGGTDGDGDIIVIEEVLGG